MLKLLFLDYRDLERCPGFTRRLTPPQVDRRNPLVVSDHPAEGNLITTYGSVVHRADENRWQMWYTCNKPVRRKKRPKQLALAYLESDDGLSWRRPELDVVRVAGKRTHLVFDAAAHGACVYYDAREPRPDWRYKLLSGSDPSGKISGFRSGDGIHWIDLPICPLIGTNPDSPMSLHRAADGRYVAYHRAQFGDRRVGRSESWDFLHWSEPRMVCEPDHRDDPQTQFYGLGSTPYGPYELGTLWRYDTTPDDMGFHKMHGHQQTELAYARSGHAWHRAAPREDWIARGKPGAWNWGMVQATSSLVYLPEEIRCYFAGFRVAHPWGKSDEKLPHRCGVGVARLQPDRFVALHAGSSTAQLLTRPVWTGCDRFFVNARIAKGGSLRAEITDETGKPLPGWELRACQPLTGDRTNHELCWTSRKPRADVTGRHLRLRVQAQHCDLWSIGSATPEQWARYWEFRSTSFLGMPMERRWYDPTV